MPPTITGTLQLLLRSTERIGKPYPTSGRFFASIVLHEGGKMVKLVSEYLGEHLLMVSSDYPHAETRFPGSVDLALSWREVNPDLMGKILWDNAVKVFREP